MTTKDKPKGHGGRRHGLSKQGRTPALVVRLKPAQRGWLASYAEAQGVTQAQVIRWLIDHRISQAMDLPKINVTS